jgi:hypothetical protein
LAGDIIRKAVNVAGDVKALHLRIGASIMRFITPIFTGTLIAAALMGGQAIADPSSTLNTQNPQIVHIKLQCFELPKTSWEKLAYGSNFTDSTYLISALGTHPEFLKNTVNVTTTNGSAAEYNLSVTPPGSPTPAPESRSFLPLISSDESITVMYSYSDPNAFRLPGNTEMFPATVVTISPTVVNGQPMIIDERIDRSDVKVDIMTATIVKQ